METGVIDVLDLKRGKTRQDGIKAIGQRHRDSQGKTLPVSILHACLDIS